MPQTSGLNLQETYIIEKFKEEGRAVSKKQIAGKYNRKLKRPSRGYQAHSLKRTDGP
jgi:hypothetical protein